MDKNEHGIVQRIFSHSFNQKIFFPLLLVLTLSVGHVFADPMDFLEPLTQEDTMVLIKGDLQTIPVRNPFRISIVNPDIADILDVKDTEVLLIGKKDGETPLFIWEEDGKRKRTIILRVVLSDLEGIKLRLENLFATQGITGVTTQINEKEGKIILSGHVPEEEKESYDSIVDKFTDHVMNMVKKQEIKDLIQVDMQITQLNTTLTKELGVRWAAGEAGLGFIYGETLPEFDGTIGDFFKIGKFQRGNAMTATVMALITEGKARVLSQPKLLVISGEQASILVGGQVPVRTTTTSESTTTENITYKDYGVNMSITPTIKENDKIEIQLNIEISDVDASMDVGDDVAFVTQNADTKLLLDDQQTIILAGLIKHNESESVTRVPFLSKIPIMGLLFRDKSHPTPQLDQEIVISLTPTVVERNRSGNKKKKVNEEQEFTTKTTFNQTIRSAGGAPKVQPYYMGISKDMTTYVQNVQRRISESISYPVEGRPYGWEGTTKLNLLILHDGTLAYAVVQESSGYDVLDAEALKVAKKLAPYEAFPSDADLPELNVSVPIVFSLHP